MVHLSDYNRLVLHLHPNVRSLSLFFQARLLPASRTWRESARRMTASRP
jgi:hypothetical protein